MPHERSTDCSVEALQAENVELREELLSLRRFIDSLQNVVDAVETESSEVDIMCLLEDILSNARNTINADNGSLLALDEDTADLRRTQQFDRRAHSAQRVAVLPHTQ